MMCTTVLHGGVCNRTSTPHKRGNKVKENNKIRVRRWTRSVMYHDCSISKHAVYFVRTALIKMWNRLVSIQTV